jgi:hypothetical protein
VVTSACGKPPPPVRVFHGAIYIQARYARRSHTRRREGGRRVVPEQHEHGRLRHGAAIANDEDGQ